MDTWVVIAERFGLPFLMLLGMCYFGVQLFKWLANDLMSYWEYIVILLLCADKIVAQTPTKWDDLILTSIKKAIYMATGKGDDKKTN